MKPFKLTDIKSLIDQALKEVPTGDSFLDDRYVEQIGIVGHTNPYYKLFYLIAQTLQPASVVELGSWQATGAAHFAGGHPAARVTTIDIHKDDKVAQGRAVEAMNHYDNLTYVNAWTWDAIHQFKADTKIDILFIDSWHEYQYLKRDWDDYSPFLADPALVIIDDVYNAPPSILDIDKFWNEITAGLPAENYFLDDRLHPAVPMGFILWTKEPDGDQVKDSGLTGKSSGTAARKPVARKSTKKRSAGKS